MSLKDDYIAKAKSDEEINKIDGFVAGWDAAHRRLEGFLISHGCTDWRIGFKEAIESYLNETI